MTMTNRNVGILALVGLGITAAVLGTRKRARAAARTTPTTPTTSPGYRATTDGNVTTYNVPGYYTPPDNVTTYNIPNYYTPPGSTSTTPSTAGSGSSTTYQDITGQSILARGTPQTQNAQLMLSDLGYDPGVADGRWGSETKLALNDFQRAYGLPVTSTLTSGAYNGLLTIWNEYNKGAGEDLEGGPLMIRVYRAPPARPLAARRGAAVRGHRTY